MFEIGDGIKMELEGLAADRKRKSLLIFAYTRFQKLSEAVRSDFPGLTPYAACDRVVETKGDIIWGWGVPTEVRETVNSLNSWGVHLRDWGTWNEVLSAQSSDEDRWDIASHFVEPIAFFCMLQPTSVSERLVVASETMLHHANRLFFPDEPDQLDQDKLSSGAVFRKQDRRRQLNRLGTRWPLFDRFFAALSDLDGKTYREQTRNFRDLSAHSFAPRLYIGHISRAIRSCGPREDLVEQPDGTFLLTPHPTKKAVSYALSDMPPLDLREMQEINLTEYVRARSAMDRFEDLVEVLCAKIPD